VRLFVYLPLLLPALAAAAARAPLVAALGQYSQPVLRRGDPTTTATGLAAGGLLAVAALTVVIVCRRRARALAEAYRRAAHLAGHGVDGDVVVVPDQAIEAYALPGWPGWIVVSAGMLAALDADGQTAVFAHERAHLAGRHHLFTTVGRLAAAANPLLLPLARAVDYTVERWADEHAARVTGDRRLVAATIGRAALLAQHRPPRPTAAAILGITRPRTCRVSLAWAGPVPRRVAALLAPPLPRHAVLLAAAVALTALAGVSALEAARYLHALLELARAAH